MYFAQEQPQAAATTSAAELDRALEEVAKAPLRSLSEISRIRNEIKSDDAFQQVVDRAVAVAMRESPQTLSSALSTIDSRHAKRVTNALASINYLWEYANVLKHSPIGAEALQENLKFTPSVAAANIFQVADMPWAEAAVKAIGSRYIDAILKHAQTLDRQPWLRRFVESLDPFTIGAEAQSIGKVDVAWARKVLTASIDRHPSIALRNFRELSTLGKDWALQQLQTHRSKLGKTANDHPSSLSALPVELAVELASEAARSDPYNVYAEAIVRLSPRIMKAVVREVALAAPSSGRIAPKERFTSIPLDDTLNGALPTLVAEAPTSEERKYLEAYSMLIKGRPKGFGDYIASDASTLWHKVMSFTGAIAEGRLTVEQAKQISQNDGAFLKQVFEELDRTPKYGRTLA